MISAPTTTFTPSEPWTSAPIASGSYDQITGTLANMFDFNGGNAFGEQLLLLDPMTGEP